MLQQMVSCESKNDCYYTTSIPQTGKREWPNDSCNFDYFRWCNFGRSLISSNRRFPFDLIELCQAIINVRSTIRMIIIGFGFDHHFSIIKVLCFSTFGRIFISLFCGFQCSLFNLPHQTITVVSAPDICKLIQQQQRWRWLWWQ